MNGYIQVEINGSKVGLKFNMYALRCLYERQQKKGYDSGDITAIYETIYCGYLGNCFAKEVEPELGFGDVVDYVDGLSLSEEGQKVLTEINKTLEESQVYKSLTKVEEGSKKKKK